MGKDPPDLLYNMAYNGISPMTHGVLSPLYNPRPMEKSHWNLCQGIGRDGGREGQEGSIPQLNNLWVWGCVPWWEQHLHIQLDWWWVCYHAGHVTPLFSFSMTSTCPTQQLSLPFPFSLQHETHDKETNTIMIAGAKHIGVYRSSHWELLQASLTLVQPIPCCQDIVKSSKVSSLRLLWS